MPKRRLRLGVLLVLAMAAMPSFGGLQEGLDALRRNDYTAAAAELRPLAERGNPEAQYRIALMYEYGAGYPASTTQAFLWLRKAADQGHADAQTELGIFYAIGNGIAQDNRQAAAWFLQGAENGNATAQYNLGLLYAKGEGVPVDLAKAIAWFRRAADQGLPVARYKLGVAYENGEGVAKDDLRAYANYAVAAQSGNADYAAHRDAVAKRLTPAQLTRGNAMVAEAQAARPAVAAKAAARVPVAAPVPDKCTASGTMEGERFTLTHCVASVYPDQHSVAIWFNEDAIAPAEADGFRLSSHADEKRDGKPRTMLTIMLCPGGGAAAAAAGAVKAIDVSTSHAKSPLAGVQWVLAAPADFRVERIAGVVEPGGRLAGRIAGGRAKTRFTVEFDVALPAREAAAGLACPR